jgi:hypothetical protein
LIFFYSFWSEGVNLRMRVLLPERKRASDSANSKIYWLFVHGFSLVIFGAFPEVKIVQVMLVYQTRYRPSLYTQGRNRVALSFGIVSGEGVCLDGVFVRYGGIPALV